MQFNRPEDYYAHMLQIVKAETTEERVSAFLNLWEEHPEIRDNINFVLDLTDIAMIEDEDLANLVVQHLATIGNDYARRGLKWLAHVCPHCSLPEIIKALGQCGTEEDVQWLLRLRLEKEEFKEIIEEAVRQIQRRNGAFDLSSAEATQ